MAVDLVAQLRARRESWVDVAPGKRVRIRRPREAEMQRFVRDGRIVCDIEHVRDFVVGWEGITEADLLGSAGAGSPAIFSAEVWDEVVTDRLSWIKPVAKALLQAIADHKLSLDDASGN